MAPLPELAASLRSCRFSPPGLCPPPPRRARLSRPRPSSPPRPPCPPARGGASARPALSSRSCSTSKSWISWRLRSMNRSPLRRRLKNARSRMSASIAAMRSVSRAIAWAASAAERLLTSICRFGASRTFSIATAALGGGPGQNFNPPAGEVSLRRVAATSLRRSISALSAASPRSSGMSIGPIFTTPALSETGAGPSGIASGPRLSSLPKAKAILVSSNGASGTCSLATTRSRAAGSLRASAAPLNVTLPAPASPPITAAGLRPVEAKSSAALTRPENPGRSMSTASRSSAPVSVTASPSRRSIA